jgi:hypothetical protein
MAVYLDKADQRLKYKKEGESLEQTKRVIGFNSIIKENMVNEKNKRLCIDIP